MSFLAPLYALAALAIAAPILFHFLQRKPHGQQEFSSLMFLRPSPPQLTRRHRLSNLLLLLLRAAALLLLAAAFARPFLRSTSLLNIDAPSRSVALVVDTSASLRRADLWNQIRTSIADVVNDLRPNDQVCLIAFDRQPMTLVSFESWSNTDPARRLPMLRQQIDALMPTWFDTNVGAALTTAGDALLQQRLSEDNIQPLQVVLFSDFQAGSELSALQSYQWPEEVSVDLRICSAAKPSNASLQLLPPDVEEMDAAQVRALVRTSEDSQLAQFELGWEGSDDSRRIAIHVPPGQTRVVRLKQPRAATQLNIFGDDHDFDNKLYVTETTPQQKRLLFIGDGGADRQSLYYYLRQATLDTRAREVAIELLKDPTELATIKPKQCPLIVISKSLSDEARVDLQRYVQAGGRLLIVLEAAAANEAMARFVGQLLELPDLLIEPVEGNDYSMLARIDFQHPLFAPFADPRFSDFTKIRFWKHQRLTCSHEQPWTVVAQFDDQLPAIIEKQLEAGTVWLMTSGWQPAESQLALSTKFVPLLHGMFGQATEAVVRAASYEVGQPVKISPIKSTTMIIAPDGETYTLPPMSDSFAEAKLPGMFKVRQNDEQFEVAVNVPSSESRTTPLLPDRLEQLGVKLGEQKDVKSLREEQRQMRNIELESRQKIWRWGILAALGFVAGETWLAGRSGRGDAVADGTDGSEVS